MNLREQLIETLAIRFFGENVELYRQENMTPWKSLEGHVDAILEIIPQAIHTHGGQDIEEHAASFNEGYSLAVFHGRATDAELESPPDEIPPAFAATVYGSTPDIRAVLLTPIDLDVDTPKIYLSRGRQITHGLTRQARA